MAAPVLEGQSLAAVQHRGSHVQIIASAGSGKTEVVAQRVAALLAEGTPASSIVAFTFTERAAASLKQRVSERVAERLGPQALDQLGGLYVGTIHAYCFRLLQTYVPRYETFDVLDENQLTAFLVREATRLDIKTIDGTLFKSIRTFLDNLDVVENELLLPSQLDAPFRSVLERYYASLEKYRLLTYGQQIARAVTELDRPEVLQTVLANLRHLIVDEYQDVNPAQEALIQRLAGPDVNLVVVGDDDQAIYGWRGSDVGNITSFAQRYPNVATFSITTNRRSRPTIVESADQFAQSIPGRLAKAMAPTRPTLGSAEVVKWHAEYEEEEAAEIAEAIFYLHKNGLAYRDIAILVRGRASYPALLTALEDARIPVQPAGRTGLFARPEAEVLGKTYCWLVDHDYRPAGFGVQSQVITEDGLVADYEAAFTLPSSAVGALRRLLHEWKSAVHQQERRVDLVRDFYQLVDVLGCKHWDHDDMHAVTRLGTLARFTTLLADYESVRRRARPDDATPGEQVGGQDRGLWYYKNLAIHITNYANGAYEGFDGEPDINTDAVDLTTVHSAKGLEWPAVFVPSLTKSRFPSSRTGRPQPWLIDRTLFDADRYEGSDADERRLFYVAMTRARDWLSLSRHERVTKNRVRSSPYWDEIPNHLVMTLPISVPTLTSSAADGEALLQVTFSELAAYDVCGLAYRLRNVLGFQPTLAPELGYGKAVHHVMRTIAEHTKKTGAAPDTATVEQILDDELFLPAANKPAHRLMKGAARRLVNRYIADHESDLQRVWMTERPFELHLGDAVVSGRADVILDQEGGVTTGLAIVDYKTSTGEEGIYDLQLQVYADAGRREGLDVRGAYVHDLKRGAREPVDVGSSAITTAETKVNEVLHGMRQRQYAPKPGTPCRSCDVKVLCKSAV
ncbi:ATP-dependent DNA helicase [Modestobacter sp. VKM Ac-2977]|uniref:ATP-dependent helicase n=1 Tax=Modestobacter sp. VKM Ac-2977 TaxID=3004131 RepID=UPI0022AA4417|nr:ATP-dependent DNA helicase [Modestobacter sp. VKM Ac-2977]MCZ2821049.1 ATP-dependent DNA helicase [Modestobacter sp. VKM Ac-2977]